MRHWLVKSDPDEYSAWDLERDGATTWEGVSNPTALIHLRAMKAGDSAIIYHTGGEKSAVALATIASDPRPDPADASGKRVVVDLKFERRMRRPVSLAQIKGTKGFEDFALVRISRLSVMPVSAAHWPKLLAMAGEK